jgi:hypothetical protein
MRATCPSHLVVVNILRFTSLAISSDGDSVGSPQIPLFRVTIVALGNVSRVYSYRISGNGTLRNSCFRGNRNYNTLGFNIANFR